MTVSDHTFASYRKPHDTGEWIKLAGPAINLGVRHGLVVLARIIHNEL